MAQPFCQSKAYRDLTQREISELTEEEAREQFALMRWGSTTIMPCPNPACGVIDKHYVRRTRNQWRCKHCDRVFSVTSGTPFADRKLPFKMLLTIIFEFVSAPGGASANRNHSRWGVTVRTFYQNLGKLRESLWETRDLTPLTGLVQIDCGHFCGKPRRTNKRIKATADLVNSKLRNRKAGMIPDKSITHPDSKNKEKLKNRRIVLTLRQLRFPLNEGLGADRTISVIMKDDKAENVTALVRRFVDPSATIWTDGGREFSFLDDHFPDRHQKVIHSEQYMREDGVNNNQAESFFARLRRSEFGVYYGMRPQYMAFYANEVAWREEMRTYSLKAKYLDLMSKILNCGLSKAWRGYCQGYRLNTEYLLV